MAECNTGAVDLTDDGGAAGDFFDGRRFTEAQFTDPLAERAFPLQFRHQTKRTGGKLAQGAKGIGRRFRHWIKDSIETQFQCQRFGKRSGHKKAHSRGVRFGKLVIIEP